MMTSILSHVLTLPLIVSAPLLITPRDVSQAQAISPKDAALLQRRFDPALEALRAGRMEAPAPLASHERAEFKFLQQNSTSLAALRGGGGPSDNEWTWLAIGGGIVLLAVLL